MTDAEDKMIAFLWDYLKRDPDHEDRRQTGYGTKTRIGLVACLNRIYDGAGADLADDSFDGATHFPAIPVTNIGRLREDGQVVFNKPANPYNDTFDADEQIAAEKRIAAYLRDHLEGEIDCLGGALDDEGAAAFGRDILVMTLEHFRKDLFHKESS